jgi:hypothetical protein
MPSKAQDLDVYFNAPQFKTFGHLGRHRTIFLPWGRGVGKSWWRRQIWWMNVAEWEHKQRPGALKPLKGVRITSMMPTLKQFKDVHWADITSELAPDGPYGFLRGKLDRASGQITFPGGSWVKPFPATAHNAKTSRGLRTDILDADEVDDIDAEVYDSVAVPWLSEPWSLGIELPGGTPTRGRYGLWFRMLESCRLGARLRNGETSHEQALQMPAAQAIVEIFSVLPKANWPAGVPEDPELAAIHVLLNFYGYHATYRDAPETVSALAVARARANTLPATFSREWEADPDAGEGQVYPFDDEFHVRPIPEGVVWNRILIGCDHGYEDPGVLLLIGVLGSGKDATAWVIAEIYEQHKTETWWKEQLKRWTSAYPSHLFFGDPSMPARIESYRTESKAKVQDVDNSIDDGVASVADRLIVRKVPISNDEDRSIARLYVAPNCVNTIREFGLYRRRKRGDGSFGDDIEDRHNHAMDALRYAIFNYFGPAPSIRTYAGMDSRQ